MGRHAASDTSTASPPRSIPRTLRDTPLLATSGHGAARPAPSGSAPGTAPRDSSSRGRSTRSARPGAHGVTVSADTVSADTVSADTVSADTVSADTISADAGAEGTIDAADLIARFRDSYGPTSRSTGPTHLRAAPTRSSDSAIVAPSAADRKINATRGWAPPERVAVAVPLNHSALVAPPERAAVSAPVNHIVPPAPLKPTTSIKAEAAPTAPMTTAASPTAPLTAGPLTAGPLPTGPLPSASLPTAPLTTAPPAAPLPSGPLPTALAAAPLAPITPQKSAPLPTAPLTTASAATTCQPTLRATASAPAPVRPTAPAPSISPPRASAPPATGPLRVADLRARYELQTAGPAASGSAGGTRGGHHRPDQAPSRSLPRLLPALRPLPSVRVAVRPVLTVAAIIAAVGLVEAPNMLSSSHAIAKSGTADTQAAAASAPLGAADAPRFGRGGTGVTTASAASDQRVSRSVRRSISVPAAGHISKAAANHVPAMKPGQTVPGTWILPNGGPMTSCFCMRWGTLHAGIDLAGKLGSPILAVGDGTVLQAGPAEGFGNWVVIQHANGDVSIYGHMKYFFVHAGQKVTAGEKIAVVGDQGFSTGPHLHFEVHQGGLAGPKIDPVPWLRARGIIVGPLNKNG